MSSLKARLRVFVTTPQICGMRNSSDIYISNLAYLPPAFSVSHNTDKSTAVAVATMKSFDVNTIPDLSGKVVLVTGGTDNPVYDRP